MTYTDTYPLIKSLAKNAKSYKIFKKHIQSLIKMEEAGMFKTRFGVKIRDDENANYASVFDGNTMTMRISIDENKQVVRPSYQEFYDVSLGTKCLAACPWCYTSAIKNGVNYPDAVGSVEKFFGSMTPNERPFQVAIGGGGEPTLHPEFIEVLKKFHSLGIIPNYTTNGMHLTPEVIEATKQYSGGVALSLHPHLEKVWRKAIDVLSAEKIRLNVHIIISDEESIEQFKSVRAQYGKLIDHYVLLLYRPVGRAEQKHIAYDVLEKTLDDMQANGGLTDVAFGAFFHPWLVEKNKWNVSMYEPEMFSRYVLLDDKFTMVNNSFDMVPVPHPHKQKLGYE